MKVTMLLRRGCLGHEIAGEVSTGGVVSTMFTVNVACRCFRWRRSRSRLRRYGPTGNVLPDGGLKVTGRLPLTVSCADPVKVTVAPAGPVASATILPGTVRTGGVVSTTFTANVAVPVFPFKSRGGGGHGRACRAGTCYPTRG